MIVILGGHFLTTFLIRSNLSVPSEQLQIGDDVAFVTVPGVLHKYAPVKNQNGG